MKVISIVQNKGGVGKTTITRLLAEYFAGTSRRTLCIDLDPQCSLSHRFLDMEEDVTDPDGVIPPLHPDYDENDTEDTWGGRSSTADVFMKGLIVPYMVKENLDILPAHGSQLRRVARVTEAEQKDRVHDTLKKWMEGIKLHEHYDVVVIDTSPSKGPLTIAAVRAASHILIPSQMEMQSIEGLSKMLALWRNENKFREPENMLRIIGIQPNMVRSRVGLHEGLYQSLKQNKGIAPYLSDSPLGHRVAFAESDHPGAVPHNVLELPASDKARVEAEAFCKFVEGRIYS